MYLGCGLVGIYLNCMHWPVAMTLVANLKLSLGLALFYFWLGCCVLGLVDGLNDRLEDLAPVLGYASWAVSLGMLLISCCVEEASPGTRSSSRDPDATRTAPLLEEAKDGSPFVADPLQLKEALRNEGPKDGGSP